jgi:hypothetical protein
MSQEILTALNLEATSRMTPYELVERAVGLRSEMHNDLDVEPIELEDGGTLYAVTSGLATAGGMRQETVVEGDEFVHRQFAPLPLTVFADLVELRPPTGHSDGDARLYRVEESIFAVSAEARRPFRAAAVEVITTPDPVHRTLSPIRFNGITNTFYRIHPEIVRPDETYMSSKSDQGWVSLRADQRTQIQLDTVGRDELDHEIGVLASVSGQAKIALEERHFARITNTGVLYGPSEAKMIEVDVPSGTPQHHDSKFYRIPDDATVGPNEKGDLIPQGTRAGNRKYEHTKLNPSINAATVLELIPEDSVDWTDGTAAFIETLSRRIAQMMPLDIHASYEQTLRIARGKIREALPADRVPAVGHAGCLAVAALVAELPTAIANTRRVDAGFFGIDS